MLGPEHPATLIDRHGLAHWTGEAGDVAGARDRYAVLLPIRERISGPEHPDTLYIRGNLAILTGEAGDAAGARDQYATLLPMFERVLGPEHPQTLAAPEPRLLDRASRELSTGGRGVATASSPAERPTAAHRHGHLNQRPSHPAVREFDSGHAKIPVDGHDGSRPADS